MCSDQRQRLSAQKISDLLMINLNYDKIEAYKENFGIKETYEGDLLRLADIEFPTELDEEEEQQPPVFDVGDMFVDDEVLNDSYDMRDDSTDDEEEEEEDEEEGVMVVE